MDHPAPAAGDKPVVEILHGDDPYAIRKHITELIEATFRDDKTLQDYNVTRLDGRLASDDDLRSAANAIPFFTARRLVILTTPFARLTTDAARKRFIALLDGLPDSTTLVLVVEDTLEKRGWKSFTLAHFVQRWAKEAGQRARISVCQLPPPNAMPEHIRKEALRMGGKFSQEAAAALAAHIGNDTQLAALEIEKLLISVDFKRPVEAQDVEELTAQSGQGDVFAMVDALAVGNSRQAIGMLHRLLDEQDPLSLFGMIVRQFRLLLETREILDEGRGGQIAAELHQPSFIADKLTVQARRFNMAQLEDIYHRLLLLDETMKTSQAPADLALDTFIAELAR